MTWTPNGSQTRSKAHHVFGGAPFPRTVRNAWGSEVRCDNTWYTDWIAGLAAVGLGYQHDAVERAVREQMGRTGPTVPLPHALEEEYAEALCRALGWPEQARFVKTGSEATMAAMMIARKATGRRLVLSVGYHGWHEAHLAGGGAIDIPWGDLDVLTDWLNTEAVAAVLMEPMRNSEPPEGYLANVQRACRATDTLFIMDEIVTGFRWALGGATQYYNLDPPDLACYGKAMSNGYPLAAIVGPEDLMRYAVDVSGTYGGEVLSLAAALATLKEYQYHDVCGYMRRLGQRLLDLCPNVLTGFPVHPVFKCAVGADWSLNSEAAIPLVQQAARAGHLVHPAGFNIMYAHTEEHVESLARALAHTE